MKNNDYFVAVSKITRKRTERLRIITFGNLKIKKNGTSQREEHNVSEDTFIIHKT